MLIRAAFFFAFGNIYPLRVVTTIPPVWRDHLYGCTGKVQSLLVRLCSRQWQHFRRCWLASPLWSWETEGPAPPLWFHCCCLILGTTSRFFEATFARGAAEQPVAGSLQQWEDINPATLFRLHRFIRPGVVPLGRGR